MTKLVLSALVLAGLAGIAQAQNAPVDPYGRPYVGARDWHPGPGDPGYDRRPHRHWEQEARMPDDSRLHREVFRDEYGFRYNERGDRLDARGNITAPPQTRP